MRIVKSKVLDIHGRPTAAVVTLGRKSVWGGRDQHPDAPTLDAERRSVRDRAEAFCVRHGLRQYEVYACAANGGYTIDQTEVLS